jgi:hypothetical protein
VKTIFGITPLKKTRCRYSRVLLPKTSRKKFQKKEEKKAQKHGENAFPN